MAAGLGLALGEGVTGMHGVWLGDGTTLGDGAGDAAGDVEGDGVAPGCADGEGDGLGGVGLGGLGTSCGLGDTIGDGLGSTTAVVVWCVKTSESGTITRPAMTVSANVAAPHSSRRNDLFNV